MNNREENLAAIALIAHAIRDLNDEAVFVGGATFTKAPILMPIVSGQRT